MSITLSGNGGIFTRLGHLAGALSDSVALQGAAATARVLSGASMATRGTTLETDAAYSPAVSRELDGHWQAIEAWRGSQSSLFSSFRQVAEKIVIRQVDIDASLPSKDITSALTELIRQMRANGDDLNGSTVSAGAQTTVAATGTVKLVVSVKNADGYTVQTPNAETIRFTVTSDALTGGATARNEAIGVKGAAAVSDTSSYLWPAGSGCSTTISVTDAQANNARGNLLVNGSFEDTTTTSVFDNWTLTTGVAGTDALSSTDSYTLSKALKLVGDGATLTTLRQSFDTTSSSSPGAGGTPAELLPNTSYAIGFFMKRSGTAPSTGVLTVSLVDGSGTVTADKAGTNNAFTCDVTALTASYAFFSGTFRTPLVLPASGLRLQLATSTAMDSGKIILLDDLAMCRTTSLYAGGPSVAAFAGSVDAVKADQWTVAISCTMGTFAAWLERLFALRAKGLQFPHDDAAGETVADSLVA